MNRFRYVAKTMMMLVVILATSLMAQNAGIQYFYDDLGRLIRVVDQNGNVASYSYDAVGNILSISRSTLPANNGLTILNFAPQSGPVGQVVNIQGQGFSTTVGNNTVQFNGNPATITAATATNLTVVVPSGATTGPISVLVSGQSVQSQTAFTIAALSSILISPDRVFNAAVGLGEQFVATGSYSGTGPQNITSTVTWASTNPSVATVNNQGLATVVGNRMGQPVEEEKIIGSASPNDFLVPYLSSFSIFTSHLPSLYIATKRRPQLRSPHFPKLKI